MLVQLCNLYRAEELGIVTSIIFFSHSQQQCGVHQFGRQVFAALRESSKFDFIYCEASQSLDLREAVVRYNPAAVLFNFHPATMGWAAGWPAWSLQIPTVGIMHEMTAAIADQTDDATFDYYILHDPSAATRNPIFFTTGRLVPEPRRACVPSRFTIGSFGFATPEKGFEAVVARAHAEFDDCLIRLNIPSSEFCDKDGAEARAVAERCRALVAKPGVDIEVTHDFMDLDGIITFLAENSLNAFFYEDQEGRGVSSAIDLALAARRPIAARRTSMVRHLFNSRPSIFVEERSLREIADSGLTPLQPFIEQWTAEHIRIDYERMLEAILTRESHATRRSRWFGRVARLDERRRVSDDLLRDVREREAIARQSAAQAATRAEKASQAEGAARQAEATARQAEAAATKQAKEAEAAAAKLEQELANREKQLLVDLRSGLEEESRALAIGLAAARLVRAGARLLKGRWALRRYLKSAADLVQFGVRGNSVAARVPAPEGKANGSACDADNIEPSAAPAEPAQYDVNVLLHQSRSALLREMPPGAQRLLSAGCSGNWYFDWIEQCYGQVREHVGIEFYAPRPEVLPPNVTWVSNTAANMAAVESRSCDLVFSGQNLEHLWGDEVAGFLVEAARVLKPGGHLVVDSPNRGLTRPLNWSHPEHTVELTVPEIRRLLELAAFDVTKEAGLWLCRDPKTSRVLPFDPNVADPGWSVIERLVSARNQPEHSFIWWLEGCRSVREPDRAAIDALIASVYRVAWPERIQRLTVPPGRLVEARADGDWIVVPLGDVGVVFYGPYMPLRAGRYRVTFEFAPDQTTQDAFAVCDVLASVGGTDTVLRRSEVTGDAKTVVLEVALDSLAFGGQFRCFSTGAIGFAVRRFVALEELDRPR
jgi:SAM-dependent methyltransferase